jgi:tRNA(Ile)-lysidine synthase
MNSINGIVFSKNLIDPADRILVALSGGPDSVCLTYLLYDLRQKYSLKLHLAHVNYKLRGEDSEKDQEFCCNLAEKLNLPLTVKTCDLRHIKQAGGNLQAEARKGRMLFFDELFSEHNLSKVALGHNFDDRVETILANLIRGCGLGGLRGMRSKEGNLIRPLINTSKDEILSFLKQNQIEFRLDRSNLGFDYTRNRLRNKLLPLIRREYNPRFDQALARLAELARMSDDFIKNRIDDFMRNSVELSFQGNFVVELDELKALEKIEQYYLLSCLIHKLSETDRDVTGYDMIQAGLALLDAVTGKRADLGSGFAAERGDDCLVVFKPVEQLPEVAVQVPGVTDLHEYGVGLQTELVSSEEYCENEFGRLGALLDFDKLQGEMYIRQYREGDRFRPLGLSGTKKLSDFFTDRKLPRALRKEIPLLVCDSRIAWVVGQEIAEDFKIESSSRRIMKLWVTKFVQNVE